MAGAPQGGGQTVTPNVNQAAAQGIYGAGLGTAQGMTFDPGTLAQTDINQYQNPFTEQVIRANEADILRGAQMGLNEIGTQATRAGAFGGSRQGIAEAEMGRNVLQQLAQSSAGLRQQGFNTAQQMAQQDIQNRLAAQGQRTGAASQLANISQTGFGMGQQALAGLQQTGAQQQAIQQALIDASKGQFAGYAGAPASTIGYLSQALGATTVPQTTTTSKQPGVFDYLTLAATAYGSDQSLKTDIKPAGKLGNGIELFTWKWNSKAKDLGVDGPTKGVIAQRIQKLIPEAVMKHYKGYLMVDYGHPALKGALDV